MGWPCFCNSAATVEESTPPDMATAIMPGVASGETGRESNWTCVDMLVLV